MSFISYLASYNQCRNFLAILRYCKNRKNKRIGDLKILNCNQLIFLDPNNLRQQLLPTSNISCLLLLELVSYKHKYELYILFAFSFFIYFFIFFYFYFISFLFFIFLKVGPPYTNAHFLKGSVSENDALQ